MKRPIRTLSLAIGLVCASAVGLVGCAPADGESANTLNIMGFGRISSEILDQFKEETGITVNVETVDSADYPQVLQTRISAQTDIDIINLRGGAEFNKYAEAGSFADLTGEPFLENLTQAGIEPGLIDGENLGFSASTYAIGVFYNKDLFAQLGLSIPTTWDEFSATARTIADSGIAAPLAASAVDAWTNQYIYHNALAISAQDDPSYFADLRTGDTTWDENPLFVKQIQRFDDLAKANLFMPGAGSLKYLDAAAAFNTGRAGMWMMGSWALYELAPEGFTPGAFALPINSAGADPSPASLLSDNVFAVTSWSKKQDAAKQFLSFFTEKEIAAQYAEQEHRASAVKDVQANISPYQADWDALALNGIPFPSNLGPSLNWEAPNLLGGLLAGTATPVDVVDGFQRFQESDNASTN